MERVRGGRVRGGNGEGWEGEGVVRMRGDRVRVWSEGVE